MAATVSIIIPCYNKGKYIAETFQSVCNQTYSNWECIVVDDGSTDHNTVEVLKKLTHPKLKVFFNENNGVSHARNFAIANSSGDYILPLDADDLLAPTFLSETVHILERNKSVKVVTCDVGLFGKKSGTMKLPDYNFNLLLARNILVVTCLFRKSDYALTKGYDEKMRLGFEDWDFWISLLAAGGEVVKINKVLFYYRIVAQSRNYSIRKDQFAELRKTIYTNHKAIYSNTFIDPTDTFEYHLIRDSAEYRVGTLALKPIRWMLGLLNGRN